MVSDEHVDPVYTYVDAKIDSTKNELLHKISILSENLLQTERYLASLDVDTTHLHMIRAIRKMLQSPTRTRAQSYIGSEHGKSMEAIKNSGKPLIVAQNFRKECIKYSEQYKLGAYSD